MSAPVDVRKAMRVAEAYCYDAGASNAAKSLRAASDAVAELIEAATEYFNGYCVDEADDEITYGEGRHARGCWTGCTLEQHEAAKRLRAAIARAQGEAA